MYRFRNKLSSCICLLSYLKSLSLFFSLASNMDQNTKINTVNTGIDMAKKYGNFTFEDILDGIFSQEEMDDWKTAEKNERIVKTKDKPGFFLILVNNFSYLPVIAVTTYWLLQFSPWSYYSVSITLFVIFATSVIHLALFK